MPNSPPSLRPLRAPSSARLATLRSLGIRNYRLWAAGSIASNVGTWMQRTAQDWLVLTQLTHHSASAVGLVMALQFGPQLLFLPWTGFAADSFDRRRLIMATQAALGVLALVLGVLTVTGLVRLWEVFIFAFLSGTVSAFDAPARQTFVADLVDEQHLANAVALNSISFNSARMIGPAVAGLCIAAWGTGWAFLANGLSFFAVLGSLGLVRVSDLHPVERARRRRGNLAEGLRYVARRGDLRALMGMLFLIGGFGLNFPIFISTMSVTVFHMGPGRYGLLTSTMAVGTTLGALLAARRERPRFDLLVIGAFGFGAWLVLAAVMPSFWAFAVMLVPMGISALTFTNSSNSFMQLATEPTIRGRVMALRMAMVSGVTLIGAPVVGYVADRFGPRWALGIGALSCILAGMIGLREWCAHRRSPALSVALERAATPVDDA